MHDGVLAGGAQLALAQELAQHGLAQLPQAGPDALELGLHLGLGRAARPHALVHEQKIEARGGLCGTAEGVGEDADDLHQRREREA
jgi:hypothetical protein